MPNAYPSAMPDPQNNTITGIPINPPQDMNQGLPQDKTNNADTVDDF